MKLLVLLVAATAAFEWKPKMNQPKANEVQALSCKNGRDVLSDGQEVTIETPNYPANYPNKAKCNWNIRVPAGEEVHIWCETFDVKRGDKLWIKGITEKIYGTFSEGTGDVIPASSKRRTFRVKFRSNKKKTGGGFRCQIAAVPPTTGSGSTSGTGPGSGSGSGFTPGTTVGTTEGPTTTAGNGTDTGSICQCGVWEDRPMDALLVERRPRCMSTRGKLGLSAVTAVTRSVAAPSSPPLMS